MKKRSNISRRKAVLGLGSVGAFLLSGCKVKLPPTYGNILRMGDALTYAAQRTLLPGQSLAKEYTQEDISSFPGTSATNNPADPARPYYSEEYKKLHDENFAGWKLAIDGKVDKPGAYSLGELRQFASRTQITKHTCEEGWSGIAEWTGVPLSVVLQAAGIRPEARFVNFYAYDDYMESIDMMDAFHPQTILAYGMNGKDLPVTHGAPVRLRVERQIGYKSVKYIKRIEVTDKFVDNGDTGWAWYVGI